MSDYQIKKINTASQIKKRKLFLFMLVKMKKKNHEKRRKTK